MISVELLRRAMDEAARDPSKRLPKPLHYDFDLAQPQANERQTGVKTMARKPYLPQDVRRLNPDDLLKYQLKVLLEYMGVPARRIPKEKSARVAMLRDFISSNPEKLQQGYDVAILNKVPEAAQEVLKDVEAMKAHFYSAMSELLSSEQADAMREKFDAIAASYEKTLVSSAKQALAEAAKNYRPIKIEQGKTTRVVKGVLPDEFERIVQLGSQRVPIMLVGPAGCGKTYIAGKLAEALDLPFYDQSCSEGVSESTFMGWLLPVGASGKFEYVSAPFVEAYEKGGVFLLDEIDAADPNLLTFLNKAIANDSFYLPQRHKNPLVKKHKDFVVIAAANTFGKGADAEYVGRNALDAATLDRFRAGMIHMDYSKQVEESLVDGGVLEWGRKVRECIYANKLRRIMSTRVMLDLTKLTANCGWKQEDWERCYFADWSKDELMIWQRHVNAENGVVPPMPRY